MCIYPHVTELVLFHFRNWRESPLAFTTLILVSPFRFSIQQPPQPSDKSVVIDYLYPDNGATQLIATLCR